MVYACKMHACKINNYKIYLIGVHLIGVYHTAVHHTAVHYTGVHLMGVYLTGLHLIGVQAPYRRASIFNSRSYQWPKLPASAIYLPKLPPPSRPGGSRRWGIWAVSVVFA
jgi:hypothetical protein